MTHADLETLLDYHYWARNRMLDAAAALSPDDYTRDVISSFRSVRDTVAHIYGAEWAWHQRWIGYSPAKMIDAAGFVDVATVRHAWELLETQVRMVIRDAGEAGVERVYEYTSFSGATGRSTLVEMVQHLVNHASYHRGQVVTLLRQLGAPPAKGMDLILFFRERASAGA